MKSKLLTILFIVMLVFGVVIVSCNGELTPPAEEKKEKEVNKLSFGVWDPSEIPIIRVIQSSWAKWMDTSSGQTTITFHSFEIRKSSAKPHRVNASSLCNKTCSIPVVVPNFYPVAETIYRPLLSKIPVLFNDELSPEFIPGVRIFGRTV